VTAATAQLLERLAATIEARRGADPARSYVARLLAGEEDALLKKLAEETAEAMLAAKAGDRGALVREMADLWFHCLVVLARWGVGPAQVLGELALREGVSGLDEKAARQSAQKDDR